MPAHAELLTGFEAALRGAALPAGLTASDPEEVERRFAVYRNNVAVSLTDALSTRFPVIRRLVGDEFFVALARLYAEMDRPKSPVLAEWGSSFPDFLSDFPPLAAYRYMADVARIEYARGRAFHSADASPIDPVTLAAADPGSVRLVLHPSVILLSLAYPAVTIWAQNQSGGEALPPGKGRETALILRNAIFQVPVRAVGKGDAALLRAIQAGETLSRSAELAQEAEQGHDPQPLLVELMQAGVIIDTLE